MQRSRWQISSPSSATAGESSPSLPFRTQDAVLTYFSRYRTLTDRVLGMRLTYAQRTMNRNVSFEFLNRQLVWHAFTVSISALDTERGREKAY